MTNQLVITVGQARALADLAPKNDSRTYLCGVCFDFTTRRAIVTNGHYLLALNCKAYSDNDALGDAQAVIGKDQLRKFAVGGKKTENIVVFYDGEAITLRRVLEGTRQRSKPLEGRYPDYQQVIPEPNGKPADFNLEYLAMLNKALWECCAPASRPIDSALLTPNGTSAGTVHWPGYEREAIGVVIPMLAKGTRPSNPAFPVQEFSAKLKGV